MEKLTGKFLVASPEKKDPTFARTVIFMAGHEAEQGAIGMVVNRTGAVTMGEVYRQLGIDQVKEELDQTHIGWGGPVQNTHGYILHTPEKNKKWDVTLHSGEKIAVTVSSDIVFACARDEGPRRYYIVLGCAAWSPGQLEEELGRNDWLVASADPEVVFSLPVEDRYDAALALVGIENNEKIRHAAAFANFTQAGHA